MKLLREWSTFDFDRDMLKESMEKDGRLLLKGILQRANAVNQNNRIYPRDILAREIEDYQTKIKEETAWGELDHCLTENHYIYTTSGWKKISEIVDDEEIYTLDVSSGHITKETIKRKIAKPYSGRTIKIFNKSRFVCEMTEDHNVLLWNRYDKPKKLTAAEVVLGLQNGSCELAKGKLKISGQWISTTTPEMYTIPGTNYTIPSKTWVALLGIWLAEGYVSGSKGGRIKGYKVGITQKKEETKEEIRNLLVTTNMPWKEQHYKSGKSDFCIGNKQLHSYFKQFGNSSTKFVPKEILDWDKEHLETLLTWMLKGDGRNRIGWKKQLIRELATVSEQLAYDTEEIFFKLGTNSSIHIRGPQDYCIRGRKIKAENCKPLYIIAENKTNIYLDFRTMIVETQEVNNKMVYCVSTTNGNFLTKGSKNSKAYWTGNCDQPIVEYKNVSHIVREARMDGNDVYGVVEIIDTPAGNIVKSIMKFGKVGISSRSVGSVRKQGDHDVVQDDLHLICWDLVSEPSTIGAFISEGREISIEEYEKSFTKAERINRIIKEILIMRTKR